MGQQFCTGVPQNVTEDSKSRAVTKGSMYDLMSEEGKAAQKRTEEVVHTSTILKPEDVVRALTSKSDTLKTQAETIVGFEFQQAINCCQLTALAYGFTSVGFPTSVDDLFMKVGIDVESAVGDGMTLSETYEAALRYTKKTKANIFCECYHFDEFAVTREGFIEAIKHEGDNGLDDVVLLNFHSGIVHHGDKNHGGGGHFSVLVGYCEKDDLVLVADVHPIKYGAFWAAPSKYVFDAMVDKDSCGRSRGMIRLGLLDKNLTQPLPGLDVSLVDWVRPPVFYKPDNLFRFIPKWDVGLGSRNMEGTSALALAFRVLEGENVAVADVNSIMHSLGESYKWHLNEFVSTLKMYEMAKQLFEKKECRSSANRILLSEHGVDYGKSKAAALQSALKASCCDQPGTVALVSFDINRALGAEMIKQDNSEAAALAHGVKQWGILTAFNPNCDVDDKTGVMMAATTNIIMFGRLWSCSLKNMADAMLEDEILILKNENAEEELSSNITSDMSITWGPKEKPIFFGIVKKMMQHLTELDGKDSAVMDLKKSPFAEVATLIRKYEGLEETKNL